MTDDEIRIIQESLAGLIGQSDRLARDMILVASILKSALDKTMDIMVGAAGKEGMNAAMEMTRTPEGDSLALAMRRLENACTALGQNAQSLRRSMQAFEYEFHGRRQQTDGLQ